MSQCTSTGWLSQCFEEHKRLAYWLARHWTARLLAHRGRFVSAELLEELAQDAVCRGFSRLIRCEAKPENPKAFMCSAITYGALDALRAKSTFGSISESAAIRGDAMNRFVRVTTDNDGARDLLDGIASESKPMPATRCEIEFVADRELPEHLRATAVHAAIGLTQSDSAKIQGATVRTVGRRIAEVRRYLNPSPNAYAAVVEALQLVHAECPTFPASRD